MNSNFLLKSEKSNVNPCVLDSLSPEKTKKHRSFGFTLMEVIVVILMVAVLASVAIPLYLGRVNEAKWTEAKAAAGTIRTAVRAFTVKKSPAAAQTLTGTLSNDSTLEKLGFRASDITGVYFAPADYNIDAVNNQGYAQITVTANSPTAPPAGQTKTLTIDGTWQ